MEKIDAINIIECWLSKKSGHYWSREPFEIIFEIEKFNGKEEKIIPYEIACNILKTAETCKMHGQANKGIIWIKDQWKIQCFLYEKRNEDV